MSLKTKDHFWDLFRGLPVATADPAQWKAVMAHMKKSPEKSCSFEDTKGHIDLRDTTGLPDSLWEGGGPRRLQSPASPRGREGDVGPGQPPARGARRGARATTSRSGCQLDSCQRIYNLHQMFDVSKMCMYSPLWHRGIHIYIYVLYLLYECVQVK